jgi:hypothetical protein
VLVLWRQDNVLFTGFGFIDPWFYVGYAKNLVEFKRVFFPGHYTGSRLAWILPCYLVHSLFSPVPAACILHLGVWTVAVLSFFFTLSWISGVRSAFLTTVLLGTHMWFWYAVGWDYPDGAAMACVLLATALYTYAALRPVRRIPLVLAGVAGAAALHCTLGWAGLAPLFPLPYIGLVHAWHNRRVRDAVLDVVLWSGLGGVLLTGAFCAVNYGLDGNLWFFIGSLRQGQSLASQPIRWLSGVWGENGLSPWLWFGAAAALISLILLPARLRERRRPATAPGLVFSAQCLLTLVFLCYFQRNQAHGLSYVYYASYLMPFAFFVIGTSFWQGVDSMSTRAWLPVCGLAVAVPAVLWYDYACWYLPGWHTLGAVACLAAACLAVAMLLVALYLRQAVVTCVLAIAGFAILSVESRWVQEPAPHAAQRQYRNIMQVRSRLEHLRKFRPVRFWIDDRDPEYYSYLALMATYIQGGSYLNSRFPALTCDVNAPPEILLVSLSSLPGAPELARRALADCGSSTGMAVKAETLDTVQGIRQPYTVTLLSAFPDPSRWHPMKLAFDATGAGILVPAQPGDQSTLPLNGWRALSTEVALSSSPEGLDVRTPADPNGIAVVYPELVASVAGRYRFFAKCRLLAGNFALGLRNPETGGWIARGTLGSPALAVGEMVVAADLKQGEPLQLQIVNNNGLGPGAASFVVLEVNILRSDIRR